MVGKREVTVHDDSALLLPHRERRHDRVRRRRHRAHERSRGDSLSAGEEGGIRGCAVQARVKPELDASLHEEPLRELGERPR